MSKVKNSNHIIKIGFHRKKKVNKGNFVHIDEYALKAQKEGYKARSVYKLMELQEKFNLIKKEDLVIDIGAAPGSFLQYISNIIKDNIIIGVDLKEIKFIKNNVKTIVCDIFEYELLKKHLYEILQNENYLFDLITSDIAPNTTGIFDLDQYNSVELNIAICKFSDEFLKKGGNMILKVFKGEDFYSLSKQIKKRFNNMKTYKPLACRDSSHEEYVICLGKK